ncbi:hypothetical protein GGP41_000389 [Bipolaris sorokiniana]|uniref:Invertebrate defensins family profile domain-containing protein n=2 Tax=Cochliobolus sativus TaxID=45130 RepID=A0A8H5ZE53_COCSA|nr:uncharacterized protein COCSADRAFT_32862 [Bipolaris sorokiniana ND90Pr]EMD70251.1 hypothetical protein COCSADRAFT_32862 [Bipolaris sorokiniana ND90Pr]KAF5847617.1 hypothetical protein GGP41_000389 [Bipolaris sorokiniana]
MKLILLIATLAATALAAPRASGDMVPEANIEALADNCFHPSQCSAGWAGKCECYCGSVLGFSHMSGAGCGFRQKKCCCKKR